MVPPTLIDEIRGLVGLTWKIFGYIQRRADNQQRRVRLLLRPELHGEPPDALQDAFMIEASRQPVRDVTHHLPLNADPHLGKV